MKLTDKNKDTLKTYLRIHRGWDDADISDFFEEIDGYDIPEIPDLDSQIWEAIKGAPLMLLNMGTWHNDSRGYPFYLDDEDTQYLSSCLNIDTEILEEQNREELKETLAEAASGHCGTSHCRAGWAIHLAGKQGYELEREVGAHLAGALIYIANTGYIPDFFCSERKALDDIQKRAGASGGGTNSPEA